MKKKGLLLLCSTVLGMGLIGGTVALWAVTDNADPFSIQVSPGQISTDNNTSYITMSWGSSQNISNVANLKRDTYRKAGVLDLRTDTADLTQNFNGRFRMKVTGDAQLLAKLNVEVFKTELAATDSVISSENYAAAVTAEKKVTFSTAADSDGYKYVDIPAVKNEANPYTVVVYLNTLTNSEYEALASYKASIGFDWGVVPGDESIVDGTQVFFNGISPTTDGGGKIYAYAWKGDDANKAWPGVAMAEAKVGGFYTVEIDTTKYDYVIFNNGNYEGHTETPRISLADLTAETATDSGIFYNWFHYDGTSGDMKGTIGIHDDTVETAYYVLGNNIYAGDNTSGTLLTWTVSDASLMAYNSSTGVATLNIYATGAANEDGACRLKIYEVASGAWISNDGNDWVISAAGKYTVTFTRDASSPLDVTSRA